MKKWWVVILVMAMALASVSYQTSDAVSAEDRNVEVKLRYDVKDQKELTFKLAGSYTELTSKKSLSAGTYSTRVENGMIALYSSDQKLWARSTVVELKPANVSPSHLVHLAGLMYMGTMKFINEKNYVRPVNIVPLELYLEGVLPGEMSESFHIHALKAQAIAARSYAFAKGSDVDDTEFYQRYKGYLERSNKARKAVYETRGKFVTYNGQIFESHFSASNGGYTETNEGVWNSAMLPYYNPKTDKEDMDATQQRTTTFYQKQLSLDGKDLTKANTWWTTAVEKDQKLVSSLKSAIAEPTSKIKTIDFKIVERTAGKRIKAAVVHVTYLKKDSLGNVTEQAKSIELDGGQFRSLFNAKSRYVSKLTFLNGIYSMTVSGNGHGIGLSQTGADNRANKGHSYRDILHFYYDGIEISNDQAEPVPVTATQVKGFVNYPVVNIRTGPDKSFAFAGSAKLNEPVIVTGKTGAWLRVKIGTKTGYMEDQYVTLTNKTLNFTSPAHIRNGKIYSLGSKLDLIAERGTVYIPVTGLVNHYGMKVANTSTSTFTLTSGKNKITASYISRAATINGKKITLTLSPIKRNGIGYIPASLLNYTDLKGQYYYEKSDRLFWVNK